MSNKFTVSAPGLSLMKKEIQKNLSFLKTKDFVTVGIHEDAGTHPNSEETNAQIGATLHFGNSYIPARPWLDVGVRSGQSQYNQMIKLGIKKKENISLVLDRVGQVAVGKVKEYMTNLSTPPNAKSTVKEKGFNNPLIHTGELRSSITSKIVSNKPSEGI